MNAIIGSPEPNSNPVSISALKKLSRASHASLGQPISKAAGVRSAPDSDAEAGLLGTYTTSSPLLSAEESLQTAKSLALRVDRYLLQNVARGLHLEQYYSKSGIRPVKGESHTDVPLDDYNKLHKIVKCSRTRVRRSVTVHKSLEGNCFYSGTVVCSSVWACPVCAAKIQERRRKEISKGMDYVYNDMKKQCTMVTLTFPHTAMDTCKELREKQKAALTDFRKSGNWSKKMKGYGYEGLIRSLEITHGQKGWHPHTHELWIMDYFNDDEEIEFKKYILGQWEKACKKHGLLPKGKIRHFRKHAVDVKFSCSNSDYLAKQDDAKNLHWGIDREMAKGVFKKSDKQNAPLKGLHPFQLLDGFSKGQYWMGMKFLEYVEAMYRARHIYWSTGLKKKCKIEELSDEELMVKEEEKAIDLTDLDMFAWDKVLEKNARAEILNIAETDGLPGLIDWFAKYGIDLFYDYRPSDFKRDDFDQIPKSKHTIVDTVCLDFLSTS
jgi:hypothetical protein